MYNKSIVSLGALIGSSIGGYIPVLWGASVFSATSIVTGMIGGLAGIWLAYKLVA